MEHIGTTILNVFTGDYYGLATDNGIQTAKFGPKFTVPIFIIATP